ncbi:MAG: CPBP family intramembrane metalloprotease [Phormidesmis sp. RL_2_1]|nr:CPBP family intramembrane metalloprotease [Phormidesmis sp. RL_2_1]
MTFKRIVLSILTFIVALEMGASLISSLGEPQVGNQLQLYQTDLLVQASEWDGSGLPDNEVQQFRNAVFGEDALVSATEQYQEVRQDATAGLGRFQKRIAALSANDAAQTARRQALITTANAQQALIDQIDLRVGMVQIQQEKIDQAIATWQRLAERQQSEQQANASQQHGIVVKTLLELWQKPPIVRPETADIINSQLKGWFRYTALARLYTVTNQPEPLAALVAAERSEAERTLIQLSVVGLLPSLGALLGTAGIIALVAQRILRGQAAILAVPEPQWSVPWDWETIWQVVVGGFLFVGQIALPLVLQLGLSLSQSAALTPDIAFAGGGLVLGLTSRGKALYSLVFYLLMAASTLGVLYWSVKAYLPLSQDWFRIKLWSKWPLWGFGSYLVALPLMLGVALLNQHIWQGQGGNNPILQLVLEERDPLALGMFLFTAAVAAPVFEEILFRGFLLPSLTRYMPIWGAIGLSSLIFSAAHLSFSEVLPLTVLGAVLGFAYVRSQNLLSSILLHSTWNSVTMIGLFLLGNGGY